MSIRALLCGVWVAVLPCRSSGSQSWSNITLATCDPSDPAQICTRQSQLLPCLWAGCLFPPTAACLALTHRCRRSSRRRKHDRGQVHRSLPDDMGLY